MNPRYEYFHKTFLYVHFNNKYFLSISWSVYTILFCLFYDCVGPKSMKNCTNVLNHCCLCTEQWPVLVASLPIEMWAKYLLCFKGTVMQVCSPRYNLRSVLTFLWIISRKVLTFRDIIWRKEVNIFLKLNCDITAARLPKFHCNILYHFPRIISRKVIQNSWIRV